jgi:hypothetical protein
MLSSPTNGKNRTSHLPQLLRLLQWRKGSWKERHPNDDVESNIRWDCTKNFGPVRILFSKVD